MIKFACPHCKNVIGAHESSAGTVAACPRCRQRFRVPGAPPAAPRGPGLPPDLPREAVLLFLRLVCENRPAAANARAAVKEAVAALDRRLSAQLREVLHHADFRALESTWRGLHYLVSRTETSPLLQIRVLNVARQELARDFRRAGSFDLSALFDKVVTDVYSRPGGEPFGLLVGDYEFGRGVQDIALLESIAHVAAAAQAPFVAAASLAMFGSQGWYLLLSACDFINFFEQPEYAAWTAFRESEAARYAALTMPRVLARLPYGASSRRVGAFDFEEGAGVGRAHTYAWMSAAWAYAACVADAFARSGWMARTHGVEGGGKVEGLALAVLPTDDGEVATCSTELALTSRRDFELSSNGLLTLVHCTGRDFCAFLSAQSCHRPRRYVNSGASVSAELAARLNYLLCVSRFAHSLRVIARDRVGSPRASNLARRLNDWLGGYVLPERNGASEEEAARRPLAAARVEVREAQGRPGHYHVTAQLTPSFQLEGETAPLHLAMEVRD